MWDVFINEGAIKEHQQRFLRGKQEKEKTFIKAQFFTKKQFLLIAGTKENLFLIFDGFQLIHELNVCYSYENIYDLNVQNFNKIEENNDISILKKNLDLVKKENLDNQLKEISDLLSLNLSNKSGVIKIKKIIRIKIKIIKMIMKKIMKKKMKIIIRLKIKKVKKNRKNPNLNQWPKVKKKCRKRKKKSKNYINLKEMRKKMKN